MSIEWRDIIQPRTTPWVSKPAWMAPIIVLGPVVEFRHATINGQFVAAQAYPKGTGNVVSDKVDWIMKCNRGPFNFGVETLDTGDQLLVRMALPSDLVAFRKVFP
ncbi:hypothetical protein [Sphingobium limneticum]|uniref:Uncharacterized protein n=1 Tax=Sphingobium limneticum TaxID=1007511 RepID=A0A5J5I4A8_9SPHN|nr:hypothetical protein [Sphingobium limneticum]KAA9018285.1 hypothetical protein F4U96_09240 [Sphingobium limneticum]KAA9030921.1 hypothetical protein F4U95_09190 [Sphingobium limneticum]|tara:strand:- start:31338 stop:31652 length:315 start_codon:yes stop_codon:yes gene_type:complete